MDAILQLCEEWTAVYTYMVSASVRARAIAPLSLSPPCSASPPLHHHRTLSTKKLIVCAGMEDRSFVYQRVRNLCNGPSIHGTPALVVVRHMLDLSLRWWLASMCLQINDALGVEILPGVEAATDTAASSSPCPPGTVNDHAAWRNCEDIFRTIEVETALRSVLVHTLRSADRASGFLVDRRCEETATLRGHLRATHCGRGDYDRAALLIHAVGTLARHCLFMERVVHIQFLTLHHANEGIVSSMFRRAVRDVYEEPTPWTPGGGGSEVGNLDLIAAVKSALSSCSRCVLTRRSVARLSTEDDCSLDALVVAGKVSLIFALVDACGLSLSLSDLCDALEHSCFAFGASTMQLVFGDAVQDRGVSSAASHAVAKVFEEKHALERRLRLFLVCQATTIAFAKPLELSALRVQACLQRFEEGAASVHLPGVAQRPIVDGIEVAWKSFLSGIDTAAAQYGPAVDSLMVFATRDDRGGMELCLANELLERHVDMLGFPILCAFATWHRDLLDDVLLPTLTNVVMDNLVEKSTTRRRDSSGGAPSSPSEACNGSSATDDDGAVDMDALILVCSRAVRMLRGMLPQRTYSVVCRSVGDGVRGFLARREEASVRSAVHALHRLVVDADRSIERTLAETFEDRVGVVLGVVALLASKDFFVHEYGAVLARRLLALHAGGLHGNDTALDMDAVVASLMVSQLGTSTVAPITAIMRDFRAGCTSAATGSCGEDTPNLNPDVLELCCARWRPFVIPDMLVSTVKLQEYAARCANENLLLNCLVQATVSYEGCKARLQHRWADRAAASHRVLHWAMCSGAIALHCHFPSTAGGAEATGAGHRTLVVHCPPYVAMVVDSFQAVLDHRAAMSHHRHHVDEENEGVLLSAVVDGCVHKLPPLLVQATLCSLASVGVLQRSCDGTSFKLLRHTTSKVRRVRINPTTASTNSNGVLRRSSEGTAAVAPQGAQKLEQLQLERQRKLEACIMRVVKSTRRLPHAELFTRCVGVMAPLFDVTAAMFKGAVGELITREFLRRSNLLIDEKPVEGYEYVA